MTSYDIMASLVLRPRLVPQSSLDDPLLCKVSSPRSDVELESSGCYNVPDTMLKNTAHVRFEVPGKQEGEREKIKTRQKIKYSAPFQH